MADNTVNWTILLRAMFASMSLKVMLRPCGLELKNLKLWQGWVLFGIIL